MPEGPSILINRDEISVAVNQRVRKVEGSTKEPVKQLVGQRLLEVGTWGKHLLFFFDSKVLKIHFLMWGSHSLDEPKPDRKPRLVLHLEKNKLFFYACSIKFLEKDVDDIYDWTGDVMNWSWDSANALAKVNKSEKEMVCDVLMDQDIFAGVGNIIKNEVLFNLRMHPERKIKSLKAKQRIDLVNEAWDYTWKFYEWKMNFELKKHWNIMRKKICPRCNGPVTRRETGKRERLSHYCERCQK